MIASAVVQPSSTSETSILAPHIPSAGARLMSMKAPMLSSASTEAATGPAPVMSASTPPVVPPEAVTTTQAPAGSSTSVVDSPMSM